MRQGLLLAAALLGLALAGGLAAAQTDGELLLGLKAQFSNGDKVLASWQGKDPCGKDWLGVVCTEGRVTALELNNKGLEGPFPDLANLPQRIESLALAGNLLTGMLPTKWNMPQRLKHIQLCCNAISGPLPFEWTFAPGLQSLSLDGNSLSGSIRADWTIKAINSIWLLNLHNNSLLGTLPAWPELEGANVAVLPGNPGLCGAVPAAPKYGIWKADTLPYPPAVLPDCPAGMLQSQRGLPLGGDIPLYVAGAVMLVVLLILIRRVLARQRRHATKLT